MSQQPVQAEPAEQPAEAQSRKRPRGFETAADMVRTMLVVLALVLVVVFLGARPQGDQRPPADVAATAAAAQGAGLPVAEPALPQGWTASNSRFGPDAVEGLPTFHVGYLDPRGQYGGVDVVAAATPAWVAGVVGDAAEAGSVRELAGRTWEVWTNAETGGTTLVDASAGASGVVVAVTSRGDDAALAALAAAAVEAVTAAQPTPQG